MRTRCDVRRYSESDRNAVWAVHDEALRESAMDYSPEYNRYLRHVESEFLDAGGEFLVATVESTSPDAEPDDSRTERIVAIGGYQPLSYLADAYSGTDLPVLDAPLDGTCRIRSVGVRPEFQSEGIGTDLMSALEERASDSGFEQVVLKTTESLEKARRFYESREYDAVGEGDDSSADYLWYRKRL